MWGALKKDLGEFVSVSYELLNIQYSIFNIQQEQGENVLNSTLNSQLHFRSCYFKTLGGRGRCDRNP